MNFLVLVLSIFLLCERFSPSFGHDEDDDDTLHDNNESIYWIPDENLPDESCGKNEVYTKCGNHGCLNTCSEPERSYVCDPIPGCFPGCICKEGYLRDDSGVCVPRAKCRRCTGVNEVYDTCGSACPRTCDNKDEQIICPPVCKIGCFCKPGYVRNENNKCVHQEDCPKKCTGENEIFETCGTACPKTCDNKDRYIFCVKQCVLGCFCKPGYVRNANNKCILEEMCPKTCSGQNEVYMACGTACPLTCENKDKPIVCTKQCVPGCFCKTGYVRDKNHQCILPKKCPPNCKANEVFSECDNHGCQNTCEEPDLLTRCSYVPGCYPGCICVPGYLRNKNRTCVPEEECPLNCPDNEEFNNCGTACPTTCATLGQDIACTDQCVRGCFCKKGFVRNADNICILQESCPCPKNQVYSECGNNGCQNTCENPTFSHVCRGMCRPGCICIAGYLKNNGSCVAPKDCPAPTCGMNEVYDKYPQLNPAEHSCLDMFSGNTPAHPNVCKPVCKCKPGFFRDSNNACVLPAKCCTDPNAELVKYPNPCPGGTCASTSFMPCKVKVLPMGCQCKKGFVKKSNTDPTCVLLRDCYKYKK